MSEYDVNEAVKCAMSAVDRLCDTVGQTYFMSADPDSEFHWAKIAQHSGRKGLYQTITRWLLEDTQVSLEDKKLALNSVVNNLCAQLERMKWVWTPLSNLESVCNTQVLVHHKRLDSMKRWAPEEIHASEEVDMCMNSGYVVHASQQWLEIHNEMLNTSLNIPVETTIGTSVSVESSHHKAQHVMLQKIAR